MNEKEAEDGPFFYLQKNWSNTLGTISWVKFVSKGKIIQYFNTWIRNYPDLICGGQKCSNERQQIQLIKSKYFKKKWAISGLFFLIFVFSIHS